MKTKKKNKITTHYLVGDFIFWETTIRHKDGSKEPYKSHYKMNYSDAYGLRKEKRRTYLEFVEEIKLIIKLKANEGNK